MPTKFLLLGGFWAFVEGGGGSANYIFMGVGIYAMTAKFIPPAFVCNGRPHPLHRRRGPSMSDFLTGNLSGPLRLRVQSRSRTRLRIAASIAFLFSETEIFYTHLQCWKVLPFFQGKTSWVAPACADRPGFLVLGSAPAPASTLVSEPQIVPLR